VTDQEAGELFEAGQAALLTTVRSTARGSPPRGFRSGSSQKVECFEELNL
jgi:hypothetical protein